MKTKQLIFYSVTILRIITIVISLCACGSQTTDNSTESNSIEIKSEQLSTNVYSFKPNEKLTASTPYEIISSYKDSTNYYYALKLGTIRNVPVDDNTLIIRYDGQANYKRSYTTSKVTSSSIREQQSYLNNRLDYDKDLSSWGGNLGLGIKEKFELNLGASAEYFSDTTSNESSGESSTEKITTVSEEKTLELSFDSSCPAGYYRISNVMDYDVFCIVVKAIDGSSSAYRPMTMAKKGIIEIFEYAETRDDFDTGDLNDINFDKTVIDNLPIPTEEVENPPEIEDDIKPENVLVSFISEGGELIKNIEVPVGTKIDTPAITDNGRIGGWELTEGHALEAQENAIIKPGVELTILEKTVFTRRSVVTSKSVGGTYETDAIYNHGGYYETTVEKRTWIELPSYTAEDLKLLNELGYTKFELKIEFNFHCINDVNMRYQGYIGSSHTADYTRGESDGTDGTEKAEFTGSTSIDMITQPAKLCIWAKGKDRYNKWQASNVIAYFTFS